MLVLNLPFKALMFLTLMRPSLVLFLVLWLKLVKDFLKVRCRLALLPFLISCLIWLDLVASLPLIKERILVIILLLHFLSLMLGSVLVLMLPLLVWLTPDLRIKKSLLKCKDRKSGSAGMPRPISSVFTLSLHDALPICTSAVSDKLLDLVGLGGKSAADKGKDTRDYLAAAFPELNAWERAGADASSAGMVDAGFENQKELTKMQLDNQKEIAEMQNETQKEIAGIQSATSRQNTKDQVYAQNEMLAYQQKESTARVASIMENTNLSKQQQVSEIMRQMLTQAQTAGQYFTNDQIKEMTRKVSAEVDLVHQQTQNQRYGSSHIGATAKDISNVVTDAASGVVDIFHGIDKAVADTWNNFWKDGKADGIGSNLSRK